MTECCASARRKFLVANGGVITGLAMNTVGLASGEDRRLSLYALHTNEHLDVIYWSDGKYLQDSLFKINVLLRDHRTNAQYSIDPRLLDILCLLGEQFPNGRGYHVISGYRSEATNTMLRKKSKNVARRSYHTVGRAIDFRMPGVATTDARDAAVNLAVGGVGYYRRSNFVHIDTGPVRQW